jgi:septum formation protein
MMRTLCHSDRAPRILLASRSPERRRILEALGLRVEAIPTGVEEDASAPLAPRELVAALASAKADAALESSGDCALVIAADTVVECDGAILGSPSNEAEARNMLRALSGRRHTIVTGLVVVAPATGRHAGRVVETDVTFKPLDGATIKAYVRSGEPLGKAGAYGIQGLGALLVERVEGSHTNVQGLPVEALAECAAELGLNLLDLVEPGRLKAGRP